MESATDERVQQRARATQYRGLTKATIDSVQDDRVLVVLDAINSNIEHKKVDWDTVKNELEHRASLQPRDDRFVGISLDVLKGFLRTRLAAFRPRFELFNNTEDPEPLSREDDILYEIDRQLEPARYLGNHGEGQGCIAHNVGTQKRRDATERAWQKIIGKRGRDQEDTTESGVDQMDDLTDSSVSESDIDIPGLVARSAVSNRQSMFVRKTNDGIKRVRAAAHNLRTQGDALRQGLYETRRAVEDLRRDVNDYRREIMDIRRDFSDDVSRLKEDLRNEIIRFRQDINLMLKDSLHDELTRLRQDVNSIVPNIHYLLRALNQQQQPIPMYPVIPPRQ
ncbi:hypothetical protein BGW41_003123 [Actinomortierella wolfii]|nr:hypothetical protein BGW41_003123 [Actinomortierella wolfii]